MGFYDNSYKFGTKSLRLDYLERWTVCSRNDLVSKEASADYRTDILLWCGGGLEPPIRNEVSSFRVTWALDRLF